MKTASSQEEDAEGKETVGDDATLASKDCAAGAHSDGDIA